MKKKIELKVGQIWQVPKKLNIRIVLSVEDNTIEIAEPFYFYRRDVYFDWHSTSYYVTNGRMRAWIKRTDAILLPQRMRIGRKEAVPIK